MSSAQEVPKPDIPVLTEPVATLGEHGIPVLTEPAPTFRSADVPVLTEPVLQSTNAIDDARWRGIADEVRNDVLRGLGLATAVGPLAEIDPRVQRIADRVAAEIGAILHQEIEELLRERVAEAVSRAVAETRRRA